jgi:hypothetical protein
LPAKNTLTTDDAGTVEIAYLTALDVSRRDVLEPIREPGTEVIEPTPTNSEAVGEIDAPNRSRRTVSPSVLPLQARSSSQQSASAVRGILSLPGLSALSMRRTPSQVCRAAGAWT